jgi:murein DD-endopeptidase MepM/ murein hydrolase activator NlpD
MILPVFGNIAITFSDTELTYSKTIDSWVTHPGLDLKAEEGSPVRAALDGVVSETTNDAQWGLTIVLDHGDGVQTRYSNLSTLDLISKGQKVKKGDVISGVGKTALCEIAEEPHLHFELVRDNQNINPKNYLPKTLK